jgi:hypothetical protein
MPELYRSRRRRGFGTGRTQQALGGALPLEILAYWPFERLILAAAISPTFLKLETDEKPILSASNPTWQRTEQKTNSTHFRGLVQASTWNSHFPVTVYLSPLFKY